MRWLIDGYNVIRRDPDLAGLDRRSLDEGRRALLRVIAHAARTSRDDFVVVFDGARRGAGPPPAARVTIVFSEPPEKADDVLVRMAREGGAGVAVVTSDRAVQDAARRARTAVISADLFLHRLSAIDSPEPTDRRATAPASADPAPARGEKKGNPRRLPRRERRARRALDRLHRRAE